MKKLTPFLFVLLHLAVFSQSPQNVQKVPITNNLTAPIVVPAGQNFTVNGTLTGNGTADFTDMTVLGLTNGTVNAVSATGNVATAGVSGAGTLTLASQINAGPGLQVTGPVGNLTVSANVSQNATLTASGNLVTAGGTAGTLTVAGTINAGTGMAITGTPGNLTLVATNSGNVTGPGSSVLNGIPYYTNLTGNVIGNSTATLTAGGNMTIPGNLTATGKQGFGKVFNVLGYGASGAGNTTTTGAITLSTSSLVVGSASTFAVGQGIFITGAGGTQRSVADGVTTSGSAVITSATAAFQADDFLKVVTGTGIPANTQIIGSNATTATLSATATATGSGVTLTLLKDLVSTVSTISGTTITISGTAAGTVSGAAVKHNDTVAINAALAACFAYGGGTVYLPKTDTADGSGMYLCYGPFDGTTNSIVHLPFNSNATYNPPRILMDGENTGITGTGANFFNAIVAGGVSVDFRQHPVASGTYPAGVAGAPYATSMTGGVTMNCLDWTIDNLSFVFEPNPTISGVRAVNNSCFNAGDGLRIVALCPPGSSGGVFLQPTTTTSTALWLPQTGNSVLIHVGAIEAIGFYTGIYAYEHVLFSRPEIYSDYVGLKLGSTFHDVTGTVSIELCYQAVVGPLASDPGGDTLANNSELTIDMERLATVGLWNTATVGNDIYDPNNLLRGNIRYLCLAVPGTYRDLSYTGCANLANLTNLYSGATIISGGTVVINGPNSAITVNGTLQAGIIMQDSGATSGQQTWYLVSDGGNITLEALSDNHGAIVGTAWTDNVVTGLFAVNGALTAPTVTVSGTVTMGHFSSLGTASTSNTLTVSAGNFYVPAGVIVAGISTSPIAATAYVGRDVVQDALLTAQLVLTGATVTSKGMALGYDTTSNFGFIEAGNKSVGTSPIIINPNNDANVLIGTKTDVAGVGGLAVAGNLTVTKGALLSGNVSVPTRPALTNNTTAASTAYVDAAVTAGAFNPAADISFTGTDTFSMQLNPTGGIGDGSYNFDVNTGTGSVSGDNVNANAQLNASSLVQFPGLPTATNTLMVTIDSSGNLGKQAIVSFDPTANITFSGNDTFTKNTTFQALASGTSLTLSGTINSGAFTGTTVSLSGTATASHLVAGTSTFSGTANITTGNLAVPSGVAIVGGNSSAQVGVGYFFKDNAAASTLPGQIAAVGSTSTSEVMVMGYDTTSNYGYLYAGQIGTAYKPVVIHPTNGGNLLVGNTTDITGTGGLKLFGTTASTNSTTGALQVIGGAGIGGNVNSAGGILSSNATFGVGYASGAGGTVNQTVSRSTAVTLNKITGNIITMNTSLAGLASAAFTLTNSAISANDTLVVNFRSPPTNIRTGVRTLTISATGGSAGIVVDNNDALTAETANETINFTVIKGSTN